MSKKIRPVMGLPAAEYAGSGWRGDKMFSKSLPLINQDVCMTEEQAQWVFTKLYPPQYANAKESDFAQAATISMVNSFRLDCVNCLNADCDMRDPDVPLERVVSRDEEVIKTMTSDVYDFLEGRVGVESLSIEFEPFFSDNSEDVGRQLDFSVRASNLLRENGISTFADLTSKTKADLKSIDGLGRKSLKEIEEVLSALGLALKK